MTHNLVVNYGLYRQMEVFRPRLVTAAQMTNFHTDDYINFLTRITPGTPCTGSLSIGRSDSSPSPADNMDEYTRQLQRFNVGEDCPVFDGLFEFCQLYTSGSIGYYLLSQQLPECPN